MVSKADLKAIREKRRQGREDQASSDKARKLTAALMNVGNKRFGAGTFVPVEKGSGNQRMFFSTGVPPLDVILSGHVGRAFPAGKMVEMVGDYDVGKSTLGLNVIRHAQKLGGIGVIIDTERTMTATRVTELGVDTERLLYVEHPEHASVESIIDQVGMLIESVEDKPCVIFWDTVASTITKSDIGKKAGEGRIAAHASALSRGLRSLVNPLARTNTLLLCCNQMKMGALGNPFATERDKDASLGGKALKFHAIQRFKLDNWRKQLEKNSKTSKYTTTGFTVFADPLKSKLVPGRVHAYLQFDSTARPATFSGGGSSLKTLTSWGVLKKGRFVYTYRSKKLTEPKFIELYEADGKFREHVHKKLEEEFARRTGKETRK